MRRVALITSVVFAITASRASATTQTITIENHAGVKPAALARVERAISSQSAQLARYWGTPTAIFAPGGWVLNLRRGNYASPWGYHAVTLAYVGDWTCSSPDDCVSGPGATTITTPVMDVYTAGYTWHAWSTYLSHEILETLVDPGANGDEVCDPFDTFDYKLDGVYVSDFALPAYFSDVPGPTNFIATLLPPSR